MGSGFREALDTLLTYPLLFSGGHHPGRFAPGAGCPVFQDNVMVGFAEDTRKVPIQILGYLGNVGHLPSDTGFLGDPIHMNVSRTFVLLKRDRRSEVETSGGKSDTHQPVPSRGACEQHKSPFQ